MGKRCPQGTICVENITFLSIIIILLVIIGVIYVLNIYLTKKAINNLKLEKKENNTNNLTTNSNPNLGINLLTGLFPKPSYSYSNIPNDILLNPYKAPLKDSRYFPNMNYNDGVPININTRALDTTYRQVGILKRQSGTEMILPLIGRPLFPSRDKWNFYTISETNNMVKLPVSYKQRSCTSEYGCDNLYTGDIVYVEGYNDTFKVTIYDNDTYRYIPFL